MTPVEAETKPIRLAATPRNDGEQPSDLASRRTVIEPRSGWRWRDWVELWRSRELLWIFAARDIKVRYKQTFFGFAWAIVVPAIQVFVFTIFFGSVLGVGERVNEAAGRPLPYPLFALSGQIVWNFFKMTIDGASTSLLQNAALIRKVYVPRLLLPLSAAGKPAMDTAVVFALLLGLLGWYASGPSPEVAVTPRVLLAPLLLVATAVPAMGVGLIVAAVTVHYRDLQYVTPFLLSILFFMTPVIYSVELLPERWSWLLYLNPSAGLVEAHRAAIMNLPFEPLGLLLSGGLSILLLAAGLLYFTRVERRFADVA